MRRAAADLILLKNNIKMYLGNVSKICLGFFFDRNEWEKWLTGCSPCSSQQLYSWPRQSNAWKKIISSLRISTILTITTSLSAIDLHNRIEKLKSWKVLFSH